MDLELRHLKVVCAIADAGSVTKAANVLGLPQPALTTQLQRIERVFGAPLFERDQKGARPTPVGELVLARARLLLPVVHELRDEATRLAAIGQVTGDAVGHHRLGAVHGPILPGLVHRFTSQHPQHKLTTYAAWSVDELTEMVRDGRLDYALVGVCGNASVPAESVLAWREVAVDPVFVLVANRHPLARREAVDLAEFGGEAWAVARGDGGCFDECFATACARAGFTPRTFYETDASACLELVESGDAVGLGQGAFERQAAVTPVALSGTPLRWRHLLGWHPQSRCMPFTDALVTYAKDAYAAAVERSPAYAAWLEDRFDFGVSEKMDMPDQH